MLLLLYHTADILHESIYMPITLKKTTRNYVINWLLFENVIIITNYRSFFLFNSIETIIIPTIFNSDSTLYLESVSHTFNLFFSYNCRELNIIFIWKIKIQCRWIVFSHFKAFLSIVDYNFTIVVYHKYYQICWQIYGNYNFWKVKKSEKYLPIQFFILSRIHQILDYKL